MESRIEKILHDLSNTIDYAFEASQAKAFDDYASCCEYLLSKDKKSEDLYIGNQLLIKTIDAPDLWVFSFLDEKQQTVPTDDEILNSLKETGYFDIGFFRLAALETQKVDLTDYLTKEEITPVVNQINDDMNGLFNRLQYDINNIKMLKDLPDGAVTYGTMEEFIISMLNANAQSGTTYLGEFNRNIVTNDADRNLPEGIDNAEVKVDLISNGDTIIFSFTLVSTNVDPYLWTAMGIGHGGETVDNPSATFFGWYKRPTGENYTAEEKTKIETIGDVTELETVNKTNCVAAINELVNKIGDIDTAINELVNKIGYIDTALDSIISIQNKMINGGG